MVISIKWGLLIVCPKRVWYHPCWFSICWAILRWNKYIIFSVVLKGPYKVLQITWWTLNNHFQMVVYFIVFKSTSVPFSNLLKNIASKTKKLLFRSNFFVVLTACEWNKSRENNDHPKGSFHVTCTNIDYKGPNNQTVESDSNFNHVILWS